MAVTERLEGTRSGSIDPVGARQLTRVFDVVPTVEGDPLILQDAIAEMDVEVPLESTYSVGTEYDFDENKYVVATATYYGQKSWSRPEGENDHWIFTLTYTTAPSAASGGGQGGNYITTQGDTNVSSKSVYRINPTSTDDNSPSGLDIGGTPVDVGGNPTSIPSMDRRFSTTVTQDGFPDVGLFSSLVGKRNNYSFDGGNKGTILYLGFSWGYNTSSGLWNITHNFAVDTRFFHAQQVARTDALGDVIIDEYILGGTSVGSRQANYVFWVQPFTMTSFSGLPTFSGGIQP